MNSRSRWSGKVYTGNTRYSGIKIICETSRKGKEEYWIMDELGGELFFGNYHPTLSNVKAYRDRAWFNHYGKYINSKG